MIYNIRLGQIFALFLKLFAKFDIYLKNKNKNVLHLKEDLFLSTDANEYTSLFGQFFLLLVKIS